MAKRNKARSVNHTTLLVMGEGEHDKAFVNHMKGIYYSRGSGVKITVRFSGGGSLHDIIKDTVKKTRHESYDSTYILMDKDVTIKQQDFDIANKQGISILLSKPLCLEGMLLNILNERVPNTSIKCKELLHPKLSGHPIYPDSYSPLFDKPVLDASTHETIHSLRSLIQKGQL